MRITLAVRSAGTFPYADSSAAAILIPGPYEIVPGCGPAGAAVITSPAAWAQQ
jgi:hypothetical protein